MQIMTIGEYIKEQRIRKGLTQEELATKIEVSVRTIQRIEKGEVDPRTFTLQAISEALGIQYEELIDIVKELLFFSIPNKNA